MKALFKYSNGRLKTSRIAFLVFIILLVCLSSTYKIGKSADKVLLKIEHVFEAQKKEDKMKEPVVEVVKALEHPVPEQPIEIKKKQIPDVEHAEAEKKQVPVKAEKKVEKKSTKFVQKSVPEIKNKPLEELQPLKKSKPQEKVTPEFVVKNTPVKDQLRFTLSQDLKLKSNFNTESMKTEKAKQESLKLSSKEYFEVYRQWQAQGESMDKGKTLVNLRILNLENVYDLFQMKAVAIKDGKPHTDLEDNSRIANASLSEFSSTCFIVSNPWKKWGHSLKDAGFSKNDNIEIRYYTYEFVRDSIYARSQKAFEWSAAKLNLPDGTDPSKADVLGKVYAVNKIGGGAFGVFVPLQVDSRSHESVKINPLICFKGQKDIQALNNAGLLKN
jgi:outer membrane biosynthesis protein TonB